MTTTWQQQRLLQRIVQETPVGVEPTSIGLQPIAVPSGSSAGGVSLPGIEPGPRPSQSRVRIRHTPRTDQFQYLTRELNTVLRFRRPPCCPSHSQGPIAGSDDGINRRSPTIDSCRFQRLAALTNHSAWIRHNGRGPGE